MAVFMLICVCVCINICVKYFALPIYLEVWITVQILFIILICYEFDEIFIHWVKFRHDDSVQLCHKPNCNSF